MNADMNEIESNLPTRSDVVGFGGNVARCHGPKRIQRVTSESFDHPGPFISGQQTVDHVKCKETIFTCSSVAQLESTIKANSISPVSNGPRRPPTSNKTP